MAVTPLEPNDPQRLGDFRLTGRLGAGGMGVVYLGEDPSGRLVAVKLVRTDLAHDPTFRERFKREVEALRRVSGPRVAALVAADTEAPQPYLVVEYIDGPTLADSVAAKGPLDGPRLRALAAALAEALVLIHEVGVIHRDLKPSNVILAADQPMLVDFGIAAAAGSMPLTMVGTVIGSAGWMAPEQAAGEVSTPAVDVFTWASLVAFAGTGRPPFGMGGPEEVTTRILSGEPDLAGLPQEVRPFVEAAFIKDPLRRPSARAVLSGLVGGADEASTDELVEETTNLIEHTWVLPVTGWPAAGDATPVQPPADSPPPPAAAAAAAAPSTPPPAGGGRRLWPIVLIVALVCLALGAGAALLLAGGGSDGDGTSPAPTTAPAPPTTLAPTTTTTAPPPRTVTVDLTVIRNDPQDAQLGDLGLGDLCADAGVLLSIEDGAGATLVEGVEFPSGDPIDAPGAALRDCAYVSDPLTVPDAETYLVVVSDAEADFEASFSRAEVISSDGFLAVEIDNVAPLD